MVENPKEKDESTGKLWLILKNFRPSDNAQANHFYIQGGENIKLGRVVMRVLEVKSQFDPDSNASDSSIQNTQIEEDNDVNPNDQEGIQPEERVDMQANIVEPRQTAANWRGP